MDLTGQFLREGLLGAIVVVESGVIALLYKGLIAEKDKRANDVLQISMNSVNSQKDLLASQQTQQKQIDTIINILDRIKWNGK